MVLFSLSSRPRETPAPAPTLTSLPASPPPPRSPPPRTSPSRPLPPPSPPFIASTRFASGSTTSRAPTTRARSRAYRKAAPATVPEPGAFMTESGAVAPVTERERANRLAAENLDRERCHRAVERYAEDARAMGVASASADVLATGHAAGSGDAADILARYAKTKNADLVVVGSRGSGSAARAALGLVGLGSVSDRLVRTLTRPCWWSKKTGRAKRPTGRGPRGKTPPSKRRGAAPGTRASGSRRREASQRATSEERCTDSDVRRYVYYRKRRASSTKMKMPPRRPSSRRRLRRSPRARPRVEPRRARVRARARVRGPERERGPERRSRGRRRRRRRRRPIRRRRGGGASPSPVLPARARRRKRKTDRRARARRTPLSSSIGLGRRGLSPHRERVREDRLGRFAEDEPSAATPPAAGAASARPPPPRTRGRRPSTPSPRASLPPRVEHFSPSRRRSLGRTPRNTTVGTGSARRRPGRFRSLAGRAASPAIARRRRRRTPPPADVAPMSSNSSTPSKSPAIPDGRSGVPPSSAPPPPPSPPSRVRFLLRRHRPPAVPRLVPALELRMRSFARYATAERSSARRRFSRAARTASSARAFASSSDSVDRRTRWRRAATHAHADIAPSAANAPPNVAAADAEEEEARRSRRKRLSRRNRSARPLRNHHRSARPLREDRLPPPGSLRRPLDARARLGDRP